MKKIILTSLFFVITFGSVVMVEAATISAVPETDVLGVGQEFYVDIKVDTGDDFINAVQSKITFSNDVLEVIGVDKSSSIFNFWIGEPEISNDEGTLGFIGGSDKGVSDEALQILRIKFKTVGSGNASISMSESVVTANDGKGINVLDSIENINVLVGTNVVESQIIPEIPVELPEKIERKAVKATKLPDAPVVRVPLYPNSEEWYNHQEEFTILWDVPDDITKVAVFVDKSPKTEPPVAEEGLFTGKKIDMLDEGENYVHVQFKNSEGWGEVTHFKISIDVTSPPAFTARISATVSDNPSPEIDYKAEDGLSGFSYTLLFVDGGDSINSTSTPFAIPSQKPGKHSLIVKVFDKAGNSSEDILEFEILPLETPVIEFITSKISQGDVLFVSGRSIPNSFVDYRVFKENKEVFTGVADTDISGKWKASLEEVLLKGNYYLIVNARDSRGAVSYDTEQEDVRIKAKAIISFGFVDLGWFEIAIIIILLVIAGGGIGLWYYTFEVQKRQAYSVIANRDVAKMSKLLSDNLTEIESLIKQQK